MGREKLRQVVSHLEQRWEQVSPKPLFPLRQHLQVSRSTGPHQTAKGGGPGVVKSHSEDWLGPQWVPRFRGGGEEGRAQPGPLTEAESWKHLSISRKLEKALEIFFK